LNSALTDHMVQLNLNLFSAAGGVGKGLVRAGLAPSPRGIAFELLDRDEGGFAF
jgi:hypothetical protein